MANWELLIWLDLFSVLNHHFMGIGCVALFHSLVQFKTEEGAGDTKHHHFMQSKIKNLNHLYSCKWWGYNVKSDLLEHLHNE